MKKKILTVLTVLATLFCLTLAFTACAKPAKNESVVVEIELTVPNGAEVGDEIIPNVSLTNINSVTVTLTSPDGTERSLTGNYAFTVDKIGEYTLTVKGGGVEKSVVITVFADATAPVIEKTIDDRTAEKGVEYDFNADLSSVVAKDNRTATENLVKSIKSVELDGKYVTVTDGKCTFDNAGVYTVVYSVTDENANEVSDVYTVSVRGVYVSPSDFVSEVYVTEEYTVATAESIGVEGNVIVSYEQNGSTVTVKAGDKIAFYDNGTYNLTYTLTDGENTVDTWTGTVEVKPIVFVFEKVEYSYMSGDKFVIPDYALNVDIKDAVVTVKTYGQNQEEQTVKAGQEITVIGGMTYIEYTFSKGEYEYSQKLSVMGAVENSAILFEDMKKFAGYGASINDNPEFVKFGSKSLKLVLDETETSNQLNYYAHYTNWENGIEFADGAYNQITMQVYASRACNVAFVIFTGKLDYVSGDDFTKAYALNEGWNTVTVNFITDIAGQKCDVNKAITKLGAFLVNESYTIGMHPSDAKDDSAPVTLYVDAVFAEYADMQINEEPENTAISFDKLAFSSSANASINLDLDFVTQGLRSLKMRLCENAGANKIPYNAYYNAWLKGITFLNSDYNAITLKVYSDKEITVAFGIGTGGNANSAAYSGTNFSKPYSLAEGWNDITICFDSDMYYDASMFNKADVKQGIVYFEIDSVDSNYRLGKSVYDCKKAVDATLYVDSVLATKIDLGEKYTATFNGGESGTGDAPASMQSWSGYSIVLPDNTFNSNGKAFYGWSDGENVYFAGEEYVFGASDVEFTAIWISGELENTALSLEAWAGVTGTNVTVNTDSEYVIDGAHSLRLELINGSQGWSRAQVSNWGKGITFTEDYNAITFSVYATKATNVSFIIGTGNSDYSGQGYSKLIALSEGWNTVTICIDTDMSGNAIAIKDGIVFFGAQAVNTSYASGDPNGFAIKNDGAILYVDAVVATNVETPDPELENTALSLEAWAGVTGTNVTVNTDSEYVIDGAHSLRLELINGSQGWSRAQVSNWGKGITFTEDYNAITFSVYATKATNVSFIIGTGNSDYSGQGYSKLIALSEGWNTVTICIDTDMSGKAIAIKDGIVFFGAQAVNTSYASGDPNGSAIDNDGAILYVDAVVASKQ